MKTSRSECLELNGVRHHVRRWGSKDAPLLFMLHGWMDVSATFQFLVDALQQEWNIVAPDLAGFGLSGWNPSGYSMMQYASDIDRLVDHYSPDQPAAILAHSMAANATSLYAAGRPTRVSHFANIEGYAPVPGFFDGSLGQLVETWLDHAAQPRPPTRYANQADLAERLMQKNSRLQPDRAHFLAGQLGVSDGNCAIVVAADNKTRVPSATPLHREQALNLLRCIDAEVLCIRGSESFITHAFSELPEDLHERIAVLRRGREIVIEGGSHNLHHEFPEQLALHLESFFSNTARRDVSRQLAVTTNSDLPQNNRM